MPSSGIYISATGWSGVLKYAYDPVLRTLYNTNPGFYKTLPELAGYHGTGAGYVFSARFRPNRRGLGARGEGDVLPTAGNIVYVQGSATCKYNYITLEITGPAAARTFSKDAKNSAAYVEALDDEITQDTLVILKDLNRQAWRAGSGKITQTNGAGASATSMIVDSCRHLEPNDYIEVYTSGGVAEITSTAISNIDYPNLTLTVTSGTWSDNSYVYRDGQYNSGTPLEMMGMDGIVANTSETFEGISTATYYEWRSQVKTSAGLLDRNMLWEEIAITERLCGLPVDQLWSDEAVRQEAFQIVSPNIQFTKPENLEIAFVEADNPLTFAGHTFLVDSDCPSGSLFGMSSGKDILGTITEKPLGIGTVLDQIDNTFLRTSTYDAYTAFISIYQNIACKDRRAFFKITGITTAYTQ